MVLEMYVTGLPKTFYVVLVQYCSRYFSASECNPNQNEIHCERESVHSQKRNVMTRGLLF